MTKRKLDKENENEQEKKKKTNIRQPLAELNLNVQNTALNLQNTALNSQRRTPTMAKLENYMPSHSVNQIRARTQVEKILYSYMKF